MKEKIIKLIDVKTIITLGLLSVFIYLSLKGAVGEETVTNIFMMVVSFYFGTQVSKANGKKEEE